MDTQSTDKKSKSSQPFLTDVKTLRERARKNIAEGAVTFTYQGDVKKTIDILQSVLATEIVCVLRYTMHAVSRDRHIQRGRQGGVCPACQGRGGAHESSGGTHQSTRRTA